MPPATPHLELRNIYKTYDGQTRALAGVDLTIATGEIVSLLGPSGCGKSTLLRIIAGLELPDQGEVLLDGASLRGVPVHRRHFGLMFQDFALFPHLSVAANIAFGLRMAGQPGAAVARRVAAMLDLVNLEGYGDRSIFELSGGERQRVALARSLAPEPALLMLDEPLGSLDRGLREELLEELRSILRATGVTAVYVTHDQDEALALSDRIVIMRAGRIEQVGTPQDIYTHPANDFVARFLGFENLLPAQLRPSAAPGAEPVAETPIGPFPLRGALPAPGDYTLLIRPEAARLAAAGTASTAHGWGFHPAPEPEAVLLHGEVVACTYRGREYRVQVRVPAPVQPVELRFDLPAFQRSAVRQGLAANQLPAPGTPIDLLIYPGLATLLSLDGPSAQPPSASDRQLRRSAEN